MLPDAYYDLDHTESSLHDNLRKRDVIGDLSATVGRRYGVDPKIPGYRFYLGDRGYNDDTYCGGHYVAIEKMDGSPVGKIHQPYIRGDQMKRAVRSEGEEQKFRWYNHAVTWLTGIDV